MNRLGALAHIAAVCSLLLLSACLERRGGTVPYNVQNFGAPDSVKIETVEDYRIGPSDVLFVSVFGVAEYTGDFTVDSLGRIQMPLVGGIPVSGRTADEVATLVTKTLGESYLRSPKVQVQIKTAASQRVTIDGSVGAPGVYPIAGRTTLVQAIAMARGTAETANPRRTVIFRTINGQRMAAAFDLTDIRRGESPDPDVFANDIIVVDGSSTRKNLQTAISTIPIIGLFAQF